MSETGESRNAAWLVAAWLTSRFEWSLVGAAALNAAAYGGAILATRKYLHAPARNSNIPNPWWTVPMRAIGVMALVAVVITTGRLVGPEAAGMAAAVPVAMTSLVAILHPRIGGVSTAGVLANSLAGMIGFTASIVVLHVGSVPLGSAAALTAALATSILWNSGLALRRRFLVGLR